VIPMVPRTKPVFHTLLLDHIVAGPIGNHAGVEVVLGSIVDD
jgi:hypothetical protein